MSGIAASLEIKREANPQRLIFHKVGYATFDSVRRQWQTYCTMAHIAPKPPQTGTSMTRYSGDNTPTEDGIVLYPDAWLIGDFFGRRIDIDILYERGKRNEARFCIEISGPTDGEEIQQPVPGGYRTGLYLSAKEEITLAEAKALGKWLTRKAREYERPSRKAKMTALRGKLAYVFRGR